MIIPKKFKLHGKTIKVIHDKKLYNVNSDKDGESDYLNNVITLHKYDDKEANNEYKEQVFLHELVHHILFHMQETDLQHNEKFVNLFSELLYQFLETMK